MTPDPAVPADGSCAGCGGPRPELARCDPFCSSSCARVWYGVSTVEAEAVVEQRRERSRRAR